MKICNVFFLVAIAVFTNSFLSVNAEDVKPSHINELKSGQEIADASRLQFERNYSIRKLSDRSYLVMLQLYNVQFYVGADGVFVLDPGGPAETPFVLEAIAEVTKLPITAVMYSHSHQDHIVGTRLILEAAEKAGVTLRIIATDKTNTDLQRFTKLGIPQPTQVIATPFDTFTFEGLKIEVETPEHFLHSPDSSIIYMPSEKIVTVIDIVTPAELPLISFGRFKDVKAFRDGLVKLLEMDWEYLNGGHFRIGSKKTVEHFLAYLNDVESAVDQGLLNAGKKTDYCGPNKPIMQCLTGWSDKVIAESTKILEPKYGHFESFPALVGSHIEEVMMQRLYHKE